MEFPIFVVDAFTYKGRPFTGNPAAVVVLEYDDDIPDGTKQKIAFEMNLSETAFVSTAWTRSEAEQKTAENRFTLRWFTPTNEVELCGHATLAATRTIQDTIIKNSAHIDSCKVEYDTKYRGRLEAAINFKNETITLNFPIDVANSIDKNTNRWLNNIIQATFGENIDEIEVEETLYAKLAKFILLRLKDTSHPKETIKKFMPNFEALMKIDTNHSVIGIIVTVKGENGDDFLSRFFTPWIGVNEDPVTGYAHTILTSYWMAKFQSHGNGCAEEIVGHQCSQRQGTVACKLINNRVFMTGMTRVFSKGKLQL